MEDYFAEMERDLPPIAASKALLEPEGKYEALRYDLLRSSESNERTRAGAARTSTC